MYQAARPPLRRIMVIDQALRANRWPTTERLAQELEVTVRTVRRDIAYLRNQLRAPIEFDRVRNGYHYAEPSFRLPFMQRPGSNPGNTWRRQALDHLAGKPCSDVSYGRTGTAVHRRK